MRETRSVGMTTHGMLRQILPPTPLTKSMGMKATTTVKTPKMATTMTS